MEKIELPLNEVLEAYNKFGSINKVAKYFQVSWGVAKKACDQVGIVSPPKNQHCSFKEYNLFEKISTEEEAYWLGLLYADGSIRSDRNEISLGLQEKDFELVEKFQSFVGGDNKIQIKKKEKVKTHLAPDEHEIIAKQNFYTFSFSCKKTKENLIRLGCFPKKSKIIHCPTEEQVPNHLFKHFMRGFTDGDGSVRWGKRKDFVLTSASENFLIESTKRLGIFNYGVIYKDQFRISKKEIVYKILSLLYENSSIYMQRKYNVFLLSNQAVSSQIAGNSLNKDNQQPSSNN